MVVVVSVPWSSSRHCPQRGAGGGRHPTVEKPIDDDDNVHPGLWSAGPLSPPPQRSQCGQPGGRCTMRRPSDPPSLHPCWRSSPPPLPPPWTLLMLLMSVGVLTLLLPAAGGAAAGVKVPGKDKGAGEARTVCGTPFTDVESSALLAHVVLEGRVREKVFRKDSPAPGYYYNVSVQVRKHVWKGRELINRGKKARKLMLGTFRDAPQLPEDAAGKHISNHSVIGDDGVGVVGDEGGEGARSVLSLCVGEVQDGGTYIFFLRPVPGDVKGRYFELSALPVKKNRRESRLVGKILKKNAAQKPVIQRLKPPRPPAVTVGSSVTLRCKAKAKPTPIYSWLHDGQELQSGRGRRIKTNKRGSRLKISKVKNSTAGVYTCRVTNAVGEDSKNVTIKVVKAESIHKPCEKQTFCFNGGTCRYLPDLQQTFCQCPKRWAGRRCELLDPLSVGLDPDSVNSAATLEYERVLIIVGIVIAILVFLVICIASYFLAKRRRKRWEDRRRMKQNGGRERDRLLDQTDGIIQQPRGFHLQKETQTDNIHPPDLPPKRESAAEHRANLLHSSMPTPAPADQPFHMNDHFPVITSTAMPPTSHPPGTNGRKSGRTGSVRDSRELERRESRSRLKAVSVDDSCKDRPSSWRADGGEAAAAARELQPLVPGSQGGTSPPELIEMSDLSPSSAVTSSPQVTSDEDQMEGLPGFLSSFSPSGQTEGPIRMDTPPKDNARAQLKTPEEQSLPAPSAVSDYDVPKPSAAQPASVTAAYFPGDARELSPPGNTSEKRSEGRVLPINGELTDSGGDSEEEGGKGLPPLHISEEDLNGNLSKADSMDSRFLPPVPAPGYSSEEASSPSGSFPSPAYRQPPVMVDGVGMDGRLPGCFLDDDDCGGFLPHASRGSSAGRSTPKETYSFDPAMDSDPDDVDLFMHESPKKSTGSYSSAEVQQNLERRLRKVRADQEAIPI